MTSVLAKEKFGHRDMHVGRMPAEHQGRDEGKASIRQGTPKLTRQPPETWGEAERHGTDFYHSLQEETTHFQTWYVEHKHCLNFT